MLNYRPGLLAVLLLLCRAASQAQEDPAEVLQKIRQRVADSMGRLPNYLCTETVDRQNFRIEPAPKECEKMLDVADNGNANLRLMDSDRLRLDVAMNNKTEMYSWVGEGRFDDRRLSEIVKHGATSTGSFGALLKALFVANGAQFSFKGDVEEKGQRRLVYDFRVPLSSSGYMVGYDDRSTLTGYSGTITADAQSLDIVRLEVRTDILPPKIGVCQTRTTLDYAKTKMSAVDVLLPSEVRVKMFNHDGKESYSRTVFSGCHQFLGESKLILEDTETADNGPLGTMPSKAKILHLPAGMKVRIELAEDIDPDKAAVGDPVTGRFSHAAKDPASGLTIPKKTVVHGRIFGLTAVHSLGTQLEFGVKWEYFELNGLSHPLELAVKLATSGSANLSPVRGQFREIYSTMRPEQPGVGFFLLTQIGKGYRIPEGFEAEWVAVDPARPSSN